MSRLSPSVLLSILLTSLLFIYIGPGRSDTMIAIVAGVIMIFGMILAYSGGTLQQRESSQSMLGTLTGMVAVASAALMGQYILGHRIGLFCAPAAMAILYITFLTLIARSGLHVEEGEVLLIQRRMGHQHILRPPGLHSPLMPALESGIAIMPSYEIQTQVDVDELDTTFMYKAEKISIDTSCRITQHFPQPGELIPVEARYEGFLKLPYNYPNRDRVFKSLADARERPISEARMEADFWIDAIQHQVRKDVEDEIRAIIHDETFYSSERRGYSKLGPTDISSRRAEISLLLKQRLQEKVTSWGIEMLEVNITQVILHPDRIKFHHIDNFAHGEVKSSTRQAELESKRVLMVGEAQNAILAEKLRIESEHEKEMMAFEGHHHAELAGEMLNQYMETLMEQNPDLDREKLRTLLLSVQDDIKMLQHRSGKR